MNRRYLSVGSRGQQSACAPKATHTANTVPGSRDPGKSDSQPHASPLAPSCLVSARTSSPINLNSGVDAHAILYEELSLIGNFPVERNIYDSGHVRYGFLLKR